MKTPQEHPEADVVRRSLDAYDRRRRRQKVFVLLYLFLGIVLAGAMWSLWDSRDLLSLEIMTGCSAIMCVIGGLAAAILFQSRENTRRILKAIELLSDQRSAEAKQ